MMRPFRLTLCLASAVVLLATACGTTSVVTQPAASSSQPAASTAQPAATSPAATAKPTATPKSTAPTPAPTATPAPTPAGPTLTQQQKSAVAEAKQYLSTQGFSLQGLIDQLDSPDGGGYSVNDATVAVDSLTVDWNAEAVQEAKSYLATQPFSCNDLIQQLDSPDGGEFTVAQATYGAQQAGDC